MNKPNRCAFYVRVSTKDKQEYDRQITELTVLAISHGYKESDIDIYAEKLSGYKKEEDRPQMKSLLDTIDKTPKYYNMVYCLEISRIGRKGKIIRDIIDRLKEHKIPLFIKNLGLKTLENDGSESIATNIIVAIFSEIADEYARTFKANIISGLDESARQGNWGGGIMIPYGYMRDGKKLVINETEAQVVRDIFMLYLTGKGIKVIAHILNDKNIPTRTKIANADKPKITKYNKSTDDVCWSDKQVHDILKNTIYKGERRRKGRILDAPAIISVDTFNEAKALMNSKTHRNFETTYTYLLKDLLVCGCCGRNYFAKYKPVERGDKVYICSSRLIKGGNCGNVGVNISLLESAIYDQLLRTDEILKYLGNIQQIKKDFTREINSSTEQLLIEKKTFENKERESARLLDAYVKGIIKSITVYEEKQEEIDTALTSLDAKIRLIEAGISSKTKALSRLDDKRATKRMLLDAKDNRIELQAIYKQFISKVIINKLDNKLVLANVYISINGIVLETTMKMFLDLSGLRRKPMELQYQPNHQMDYDPVYDKNILLTDKEDILDEFHTVNFGSWVVIPDNQILLIP